MWRSRANWEREADFRSGSPLSSRSNRGYCRKCSRARSIWANFARGTTFWPPWRPMPARAPGEQEPLFSVRIIDAVQSALPRVLPDVRLVVDAACAVGRRGAAASHRAGRFGDQALRWEIAGGILHLPG